VQARIASLALAVAAAQLLTGCSPAAPQKVAEARPSSQTALSVEELLRRYDVENEGCRGGSGDDPETDRACERREQVSAQLQAAGWCYGENAAYGYQMEWRRCGDPRFATLAGAEAAADADRTDHSATAAAAPAQDPDAAWYVISGKTNECVSVATLFGVETPEQVAAAFAREGQPQQLSRGGELTIMRANSADPGMAFVRGEASCRVAQAAIRSAGN